MNQCLENVIDLQKYPLVNGEFRAECKRALDIGGALVMRDFLCAVLGKASLHEHGDTLSSINLHYASDGQELGWHFDNSSFAITLMIQQPESGGTFEFAKRTFTSKRRYYASHTRREAAWAIRWCSPHRDALS